MNRRFVFLTFGTWFMLTALSSAQVIAPDATPTQWYGTQAGIIGATGIAVSIIKRLLGNVRYANAVPTWTYAVVVAFGLTFLSIRVWGTMTGSLWPMISQSVLSAGATSGFYEWLTSHPTTSLAASADKAGVIVDPENKPARDVVIPQK
jgi:hypothetical protein